MKKFFANLPTWAVGVIAVAGVGVVTFTGWKLYKYLSDSGNRQDLKSESKDGKKELKDLQQAGQKATFSDAQYSTWANQLKTSFDGCGTSNGVWANIFGQLKNDVDVLKLNNEYGTRKHDGCNWEGDFGDFEGTLSQAIVNELSANEITAINNALEKKGIKFRY